MNFAQEMSELSPDQVQARLAERLRDGRGPAWNESQGEPRWGLLVSAFHHWRRSQVQLQAVDTCLNTLLPELFVDEAWPAVDAVCSYVLALDNLELPWHPSQTDDWPFQTWLRLPPQAAADAQLQAMVSTLHLMRHRRLAPEHWARENFQKMAERASQYERSPWAQYLLESWKAWAEATRPNSGVVSASLWFELLRRTSSLVARTSGANGLTLAMDWALGRCSSDERDRMIAELVTAIGHLPLAERAASVNAASEITAQVVALKAADDVLGNSPHIVAAKRSSRPVSHGVASLRSPVLLNNRLSQTCQLRA